LKLLNRGSSFVAYVLGMIEPVGNSPHLGVTWRSNVHGVICCKEGIPMSEDLKAKTKRAWEDAYNQGNLDALDEVVGPNYVRHQPPFPDIVGLGALKKFVADGRAAYPDCQLTIAKIIIEGDWLATQWTFEGTQTGVSPATGAPPTGKHAKLDGCSMGRVEGGKSVEEWALEDWLGFLQQLGVVPKLG
jgi:predicted ester cyclase